MKKLATGILLSATIATGLTPSIIDLDPKIPVVIEVKKKPKKKKDVTITRIVKVTAYNALAGQTDSTPTICAWGDKVRPGIIAVSRDLEHLGLIRGTEVHIEGIGTKIVMDRMHYRKKNQIDLYMEQYDDAIKFGVQNLTISWKERSMHNG